MKCDDCGLEIVDLPCWMCAHIAESDARDERNIVELVADLKLHRGAPNNEKSIKSLRIALERIKNHIEKEGYQSELKYSELDLLESDRWWYIPYTWVGCNGFIVDKASEKVHWLGSSPATINMIRSFDSTGDPYAP